MATPFETLQNRAKLLKGGLDSSPTAYAPNTPPSSTDLSKDKQLSAVNKQIEDLRSKQLRTRWYGPENEGAEDAGDSDGVLMKGLKLLQRPLNAVAGTAQYALGNGTSSSYTESVNNAMKTGVTFGNVLQQEGVPRGLQVPLGFALDVMFDPVNWATAGTSALIPRIGTGLVRGGLKKAAVAGATEAAESGLVGALKGGMTGLTSGLEKKAYKALNIVPFAKKSTKYANLTAKIGQKALSGAEKYDSLIGKTVYDSLGETPLFFKGGVIGNTAEEAIRKIPSVKIGGMATPTGDQIADFFKYSTKKAADVADLKDKVATLAKNKGVILVRKASGADFQSIDDFLLPNAAVSIENKAGEMVTSAIRDADGAIKPELFGKIKIADTRENAQALLESAAEDYSLKNLTEAYKVVERGKTGVQWYDEAIDKLKNLRIGDLTPGAVPTEKQVFDEAGELVKVWNSYGGVKDLKPLEKLLDGQKSFISIFKSAKVPMNAASHIVAYIGNFFMGAMMGLPVWKPKYLESMVKANTLVRGKLGAVGLKEMFFSDVNSLFDFMENHPNRFRQLTGMDASEILNKISTEERILGAVGDKFSDVKKIFQEAWDNLDAGMSQSERFVDAAAVAESKADDVTKATIKKGLGRYKTASETLKEMAEEAPVRNVEQTGSWTTSELSPNDKFDMLKQKVASLAEANPYNPAYRAANTLINSMPRWYEQIDQTAKIGTTNYLTQIGLTEQELKTISRTVNIGKEDLLEPVVKGAEKLFRLTPLKASEVATEAYMNYAAMPDFVKVMRALPLVGSPFISFPYAMAVKTAKTAINNPAVFNKIGFMLNEMNASRSPQERAAMEEKYNQYLKSPTVIKVFGMWNTNVKNFIPYYTMNMFNPSERTYDDSSRGQMLKMFDKIPAFQDPVGQVIKDYFIQPWILSGTGQAPQGQFGQPLYPTYDENGKKIDPGLATKAFYGGRTVAESVVPGALSYAGLANAPLGLGPTAVNLLPSYGARTIANATQGRSSIGATTKEDAMRKTFRALLGRSGIPAYTLDITKTSK